MTPGSGADPSPPRFSQLVLRVETSTMSLDCAFLRRMAIVLPVVFALTTSAFGQQPPTPAAPAQGPRPGLTTMTLSVDEAVQRALEQNLGLQVQRIDPLIADLDIDDARSAWIPNLFGNFSFTSDTSQPRSFFESGSTDAFTEETWSGIAGVSQLLPWGASYEVSLLNSRFTTNNPLAFQDPGLFAEFQVSFIQPLLRGLRIDGARQTLIVSKFNREIADFRLRDAIATTVRDAKNAYWGLVIARSNLEVQQQILGVSQQNLKDNRTRVEVGTMAPIDVVQAEAEVARNEGNVIEAGRLVGDAEDRLRTILLDPAKPEYWTTTFETTDTPVTRQEPVDIEAAVTNALKNRPDVLEARKQLEINQSDLRFFRDETLPRLDARADFGSGALGGTIFDRAPDGSVIASTERSLGDIYEDIIRAEFPQWTIGVNLRYPLGKSSQDVALARARLQYQQSEMRLRDLERGVAQIMRDFGRRTNTNLRLVASNRAARELAEKNLEAAQKKFQVGLATQFEVIQAQRDVAQARNVELVAILDYTRSFIDFEAAQTASISGGGGIGVIAGGGGTGVIISGGGAGAGGGGTGGTGGTGTGQVP
jgi:outer membrane protein